MKVCMIVHQYYHRDGRVRRYAEALVGAGAEVDVICPKDENHPSMRQLAGVRIFPIPLGRGYKNQGSYLIEYGLALILFTVRLLGLYLKNRYDVIHVHNVPDFLIFAALLPRLLGAKLILDIHDPMPEFYMSKYDSQKSSLTVKVMRLQEKYSAKLAHAVITANSNFKDNLVKRGVPADKITVVYNMADPKVFNRLAYQQYRHHKSEHFTLIYPGTIAPRYGLDVAIRALPLLIKKIPNLRLVIIGHRTDCVNDLEALAKQLNVSSFVEFRPLIPIHEVPKQMIQADIGVYPALSDPHMDIATPTKVLEFALMGIPIVAAKLKVLEDMFSDEAVFFFEPGNSTEFAACILELFGNPARRETLVQNADRIFVNSHSWSSERDKYFNKLNDLLTTKNQGIVWGNSDQKPPSVKETYPSKTVKGKIYNDYH